LHTLFIAYAFHGDQIKTKIVMKASLAILLFAFFLSSCGPSQPNTEELKSKFGDFNSATIKLLPVDYTKTPIYKKIQHHPEDYTYLDEVEIYRMAHISDGNLVTGFVAMPKKKGNYPCVVFNRGGNREFGRLLVAHGTDILAPIAAKGYIVAASNYRGNSGSEGMEEFGGADVNDVLNLIDSMSELEMADTSRVGLVGVSRGGMMNYIALRKTERQNIKAVASIGGVSDFGLTIEHHPEIDDVASELIPNWHEEREQAIIERSAVQWPQELPADVPLLIMHSKTDAHVYYDQVVHFADSLENHNVPYQLVSYEDDTHGLSNHKKEVFERITSWFDKYVKEEKQFAEVNKRLELE
jgi:dipeptidyl aminopeptidase/acylaminoacyl peptidase